MHFVFLLRQIAMSRPPTRSTTPSPWTMDNRQPDVTPAVAVGALRKLVAYELRSAGFDSALEGSLEEFEGVVWACTLLPCSLSGDEMRN